jgi:hypothetical protein
MTAKKHAASVEEPSLTPFDDAARFFCAPRAARCNWCLSPHHEIHRSGLCRFCYEIRSEKYRLARDARKILDGGRPWKSLELNLRIACHVVGRMEDAVRAAGQNMATGGRAEHSPMAIENLLRYISRRILPRKEHNIYYNCALTLGGLFSPLQRKALIHLLSEVVDLDERHNLRKRVRADSARLVEDSRQMPKWLAEENRKTGAPF